MKIIALYLPQYHSIPENDMMWGKDYTDWVCLKKGEKLIDEQYQPRIPLNKNYYDLLKPETKAWQINLAKKYGVYGFCAYHYWFNGKLVLEKPMEQYLEDKSLDLPFFFCWANHNWDNAWDVSKHSKPKTLLVQDYKDMSDIKNHFDYMLPFFKDERYMKENGKPVFCIYNPLRVELKYLKLMKKQWDELARENGFEGICFTYQWGAALFTMGRSRRDIFDYGFEYLPSLVDFADKKPIELAYRELVRKVGTKLQKYFGEWMFKYRFQSHISDEGVKTVLSYDDVWERALSINYKKYNNIIPGAFTDWDNTPRHHHNGKVIMGSTPEKFKKYLQRQIIRSKNMGKDAILIFAWNEWAEGGYLEPDEKNGYGYLEAINSALKETNELKDYNKCRRIFQNE